MFHLSMMILGLKHGGVFLTQINLLLRAGKWELKNMSSMKWSIPLSFELVMSAPVINYGKNILKKLGCLYGSKLRFGYTNRKIHVCIYTCWIIWLVEKLWNVKINYVVLKTDCPYILNKYGWWKLLNRLEYTLLKHLNPATFVYLQCLALCFTLAVWC